MSNTPGPGLTAGSETFPRFPPRFGVSGFRRSGRSGPSVLLAGRRRMVLPGAVSERMQPLPLHGPARGPCPLPAVFFLTNRKTNDKLKKSRAALRVSPDSGPARSAVFQNFKS